MALTTPLWRAGGVATDALHGMTLLFGNSAGLARERDQLQNENRALMETNRTLSASVADLERLLGSRTEGEKRVVAGVLARPPVIPYDTLIVDVGSQAGVHAGAFAFGPGGVPLGTVAQVGPTSSHIELFSTGGRVTEGWVGEKRLPITLTGRGGGAFEATLPRDSGIAVDAVVYVPGPGALPIGTVVRIDSNPSSPRDTVHIAPYANVFSLTWVELAR